MIPIFVTKIKEVNILQNYRINVLDFKQRQNENIFY